MIYLTALASTHILQTRLLVQLAVQETYPVVPYNFLSIPYALISWPYPHSQMTNALQVQVSQTTVAMCVNLGEVEACRMELWHKIISTYLFLSLRGCRGIEM